MNTASFGRLHRAELVQAAVTIALAALVALALGGYALLRPRPGA